MSKSNLDTGGFMDLISGVQGGDVEYGVELPIDDVYPDPTQPRTEGLDDAGIMGIVNTFPITGGIIYPPLVEEQEDGRYMIIDGERRWRAAKYAGHDTIKVSVRLKSFDTKHAVQVISNQSAVKLAPKDLAKSYEVLKAAGLTQKQIADCDPNKSVADISEIMQLNKLGVDKNLNFIDDLYEKGVCRDYSTLAVLIRLARKDADKTKKLIEWAIQNDSLTRKWAKSLSVKDLETPIDDQIAALEERKEHEKRPNSKTPTPDGMTGGENALEEEFQLETEQDGVEPADKVQSEKVDKKSQAPESNDDESEDEESEETPFQKKRVTEINVMHNSKVAKLLLDRADKEEGFAWIQYDNSEEPVVRVDVSELSLIFVG